MKMDTLRDNAHGYIPTLNGWRAFSILYVLAFHGSWLYLAAGGLAPNESAWKIMGTGVLGVYFFFGISGFLITTRLLEEHKKNGTVSLKSFYWRRFFRIIPIVMAFLMVISLLSGLGWVDVPFKSILSSIFFFRNYSSEGDWYTGHFWSLSMEEHYYLIWPGLFCLFMKMKKPWIPILGILLLVPLWRSIEYRHQILTPYLPGVEYKFRSDLFFDYMMWGSFTAYLNTLPRFKAFFQKWTRGWMIFPAILVMHYLCFKTVPLHDSMKAIIIQLCILLTVNFPSSAFSKFLEGKWLVLIGLYSYSLYVWQQLFFAPITHRIQGLEMLQSLPASLILLMTTAYVSYNFLETPAIAKGRKWLKNSR